VVVQRHTDVRVDRDVDEAETVFLVFRDRDLVVAALSAGRLCFTVDENGASARWSSPVLEVLLSNGVYLPRGQALVNLAQEV